MSEVAHASRARRPGLCATRGRKPSPRAVEQGARIDALARDPSGGEGPGARSGGRRPTSLPAQRSSEPLSLASPRCGALHLRRASSPVSAAGTMPERGAEPDRVRGARTQPPGGGSHRSSRPPGLRREPYRRGSRTRAASGRHHLGRTNPRRRHEKHAARVTSPRPLLLRRVARASGEELALVSAARSALEANDYASCLRAADRYDERFRSGVLRQEIEVIRITALFDSGERTRGEAPARRFLAAHGASPYASQVRSLLERP